MKSFLSLLVTSILFTLTLSANKKISLQLLWKHQFEFAGFYIAKEKGFYADVGLEVTLKEYEFGVNILDDVMNLKSDIGIGRSSLVLDKLQGVELVFLNALYQNSPYVLISKKRSDLQHVKDFKNKKIMISDDLASIAAISSMMRINNLKTTDYTALQHSLDIKDLIEGRVDLMTTFVSNEPFELEDKGIAYTIFDPKDFGFNFYSDIIFTSQAFLDNNEEKVQLFQDASMKGWEYAFNNIEATVAIILKKYNSQNKSRDALLYEAHTLRELAFSENTPLGSINDLRIKEIANVYRLLGLSTKTNKFLQGLIYKQENVFDKIFTREILIGLGSFVLLVTFLILYRQYILRKQNDILETLVSDKTAELLQYTKKLEKQKELYDLVYENSSDGVLFFDVQSKSLLSCNDKVVAMLRAKSKEEILHSHPSAISPLMQPDGQKSFPKSEEMIRISIEKGNHRFIWKHQRMDATEFWVDVNITIIFLDSKDVMYVTWKDIDEEMQIKKELYLLNENLELKIKERTKELEYALSAKSDFLANMSHEIRTPLNGIIGFIDMLYKNEQNTSKLSKLRIIKESSSSLLNIINDILDFSKLESKKIVIENIPLYTAEPFKHTSELFLSRANEKGITITLNIDESVPEKILGDSTRIQQVFSNLLSNAIKFSHENTTITVNIKYIQTHSKLYCELIDQGLGIAPDKIDKIFHYFEQADSSVTRTYGGTGLGLAISKSLVKHMGGEVGVTSQEDFGSTFYFTLKASECKERIEEEIKIDADTVALEGEVLIVEDNKTNQMLLSMLLDDLSLKYTIANDGLEAVESFKKKTFDLILMDENMPNMSGIEATNVIRTLDHGKEIPIIAVTANALKGDKERFIDSGMQDYLSKPIDSDTLTRILSKYL